MTDSSPSFSAASRARHDDAAQSDESQSDESQSDESQGDEVQRNAARDDGQLDEALGEALGEEPRAGELRRMHLLLRERRGRLARDARETSDEGERDKLRRDIKKLDEQIAVLAEEADITQFVEDAVRVGLEMRRLND